MSVRERFLPSSEAIIALLLFAAFILIQVLIGGTRLVFSLPGYIIIGLAGLFTIVSLGQRRPEPCRSCLIATAVAFTYVIGRALLSPAPYIARSDLYSALGALVVYLAFALVVTNNNRLIIFVLGLLVFAI